MFQACSYTVDRNTGLLDYAEIERLALEVRPLILLAGFTPIRGTSTTRRCGESPIAPMPS